ncbi:MAG: hypothetical protein WCO56_11095 [Verrucomicrobiota bacterium]
MNPFGQRQSPPPQPPATVAAYAVNTPQPPRNVTTHVADTPKQTSAVLIVLAILLPLAICGVTVWFTYDYVKKASRDIDSNRATVTSDVSKIVATVTTIHENVRKLKVQTELRADESRKHYEAVIGMRVAAENSLTNISLELQRQVARQLNEYTQNKIAQLDTNYTARARDLVQDHAQLEQLLQKDYQEKLKQIGIALQKYDKLLTLEPDLDHQVEHVRTNLLAVTEYMTNLFAEFQTSSEQLIRITNKLNQLDARLSILTTVLTQPPPAPPVTPAPTSTPAPQSLIAPRNQ